MRSQTPARKGFSLVEILVVAIVLAVIAAVFVPRYLSGQKKPGGGKTQSPKQAARGVECAANLTQLRQAYTMAQTTSEEGGPRDLAALKSFGVTDAMLKCPVGGQPYLLGASGQIRCQTPGH